MILYFTLEHSEIREEGVAVVGGWTLDAGGPVHFNYGAAPAGDRAAFLERIAELIDCPRECARAATRP